MFKAQFDEMRMARTMHPRGGLHLDTADAFNLSDLPELVKVMQAVAHGDLVRADCVR